MIKFRPTQRLIGCRLGSWLAALCLGLTIAGLAEAKPWELRSKSEALQKYAADIRVDFPDITKSSQLDDLVARFAEGNSLSFLDVYNSGDKIVLEAEIAHVIAGFNVKTLTRTMRYEIETKVNKYIGQTDSEELHRQISDELLADLKNQGYYQARLKFVEKNEENGIYYDLYVDEGIVCKVAHIETSFHLPTNVKLPFHLGMECNSNEIRGLQTQLETDLASAGYNQQRIQTPDTLFDAQTNTATLRIEGSLGRKITYKVFSAVKTPGVFAIVLNDNLNTLDTAITDPDAMGSELSRKYQAAGYDDVEISRPKVVNVDDETVEYQFNVNPGPEYRIVDVQFEGLVSMKPSEASDAIDMKASVGNAPAFSQELVASGRERLMNLYKQRGYWDAQVFDPRIIKNPATGEVKIVYVVREGKKRIFDRIVITGNQAIPMQDILDLINIEPGEPLDRGLLVGFETQLRNLYRTKGYLHVTIGIDLQQNRDLRDVETKIFVTISENQRSHFGEVFVKGLIKTNPKIVLREMRFKPGDPFNPDLVEESRQAIVDLGLFSSISMVPTESAGKDSSISYTLLVREARSGTIGFGPGWSRAEGLRFTLEGAYNNIDGNGRKIFSKGTLNEERDQTALGGKTLLGRYAGIGYFEPWLFDKPVDGTLAFNYQAQARDNLWEITRTAEATASHRVRRLKPKTLIEVFTRYKEAREEAEGSVKDATLIDSGDIQIREIGMRHVTDGRNNLSWPTKGYRVTTELSTANFVLGGGVKYVRWGLGYNIYREIVPNLVIAAGFNYTTYENVRRLDGSDVLPISERLESGGADSNRGFRDNTLGPVFTAQDGTKIYDGGSRRSAHKLELRYQIIPDTIAITTFLDSSNSAFSKSEEKMILREQGAATPTADGKLPQFADNAPYQFESVFTHPSYLWTKNYVSYGIAGNYLTPLGSVNASLGWPLKPCLDNQSACDNPRGNSNYRQLTGAVFSLNIGANF